MHDLPEILCHYACASDAQYSILSLCIHFSAFFFAILRLTLLRQQLKSFSIDSTVNAVRIRKKTMLMSASNNMPPLFSDRCQ